MWGKELMKTCGDGVAKIKPALDRLADRVAERSIMRGKELMKACKSGLEKIKPAFDRMADKVVGHHQNRSMKGMLRAAHAQKQEPRAQGPMRNSPGLGGR